MMVEKLQMIVKVQLKAYSKRVGCIDEMVATCHKSLFVF